MTVYNINHHIIWYFLSSYIINFNRFLCFHYFSMLCHFRTFALQSDALLRPKKGNWTFYLFKFMFIYVHMLFYIRNIQNKNINRNRKSFPSSINKSFIDQLVCYVFPLRFSSFSSHVLSFMIHVQLKMFFFSRVHKLLVYSIQHK